MKEKISEIVNSLRNAHDDLLIEHHVIVKNGVEKNAIVIREKSVSIAPSIYVDEMLDRYSKDEICDLVFHQYESHKAISIDISALTDKAWILDHLNIGVQRASGQELVKRTFPQYPDIEFYLYVADTFDGDESFSIKLSPSHLEMSGIDSESAWNTAMEHLSESITIESMHEAISHMVPALEMPEFDPPMYIVSNKRNTFGASSIIDRNFLKDCCDRFDCDKLVIIPSSIHEVILLPACGYEYCQQLTSMVQEVNATQVLPEEQLCDHVFVFERS